LSSNEVTDTWKQSTQMNETQIANHYNWWIQSTILERKRKHKTSYHAEYCM